MAHSATHSGSGERKSGRRFAQNVKTAKITRARTGLNNKWRTGEMVGELADLLSERTNSTMSAENLTRFLDKIEAEIGYLEEVAKELATLITNQSQSATTSTNPVANTEKPWR